MTPFHFILGLRSRGDALARRCAAMILRRRLRHVQSQLPLAARAKADFWRTLYLARNARLQREREARRKARAASGHDLPATQSISKADVLAAIARSRAHREARLKGRQS